MGSIINKTIQLETLLNQCQNITKRRNLKNIHLTYCGYVIDKINDSISNDEIFPLNGKGFPLISCHYDLYINFECEEFHKIILSYMFLGNVARRELAKSAYVIHDYHNYNKYISNNIIYQCYDKSAYEFFYEKRNEHINDIIKYNYYDNVLSKYFKLIDV